MLFNSLNLSEPATEAFSILGTFFAFFSIISLAVVVFKIVVTWKIFARAGEKGWKSLIPVYNSYTETKLVWKPLWFWIMLVAQIVFWGLYAYIMVSSVALDQGGGMDAVSTLLTALLVLVLIGVFIIVIQIIQFVYLSRSFGEGDAFAVGLVFLPVIFRAIIAFGSNNYLGNGYEISRAKKTQAEAAALNEPAGEKADSWYEG